MNHVILQQEIKLNTTKLVSRKGYPQILATVIGLRKNQNLVFQHVIRQVNVSRPPSPRLNIREGGYDRRLLLNGMVHMEWSEFLNMWTQQKAVVDEYDLNIVFKGPQGCALVVVL